MSMNESDRFVYRGNASILSGHLHQPADIDLNLGGSALPLSGGQSRHRIEHQNFGGLLAFTSAETAAHGAAHDSAGAVRDRRVPIPPAQATVSVVVRGLSIATRPALHVKCVAAALTAACARSSKEPSIGALDEARFEGVAFDGHRLMVSINRAFFKIHDTLTRLTASTSGAARTKTATRGPILASAPRSEDDSTAPVLTTIVKSLRWLDEPFPGSVIEGHVLTIPSLGRVFFGEMFVSGPTRRLTMLRFEFSGDIVFDGACCEVETGGNWRS
jgi:hypothetical protein